MSYVCRDKLIGDVCLDVPSFLPPKGIYDIIIHCTSTFNHIPFGLVVRIPGFHPGGPGSIPGMGNFFVFHVHFC